MELEFCGENTGPTCKKARNHEMKHRKAYLPKTFFKAIYQKMGHL
jgi:hypothetical protein